MDDLALAWYNLFETIYNNFVEPLTNALYETSLIEMPLDLCNQLINAIFNLFRETPIDNLIYVGSDDLAHLFGIFILIVIIIYIIKLFKFVIIQLKNVIKSLSSNSRKKTWRKQWKRKETL